VRVEGAACLLRTAGHARVKKIRELFFCIYSTPLIEPVWFGWGFFGSVRLGFFRFQVSETEPNFF
jgi:hypothetical protein